MMRPFATIAVLLNFLFVHIAWSQTAELSASDLNNGGGDMGSENHQVIASIGGSGGSASSSEFGVVVGFQPNQSTLVGNSPPTAIRLSNSLVVNDSESGSLVGQLFTDDLNVTDNFVYALVEGEGDTNNDLFAINSDRLITDSILPTGSYSIRVSSNDGFDEIEETFIVQTVIVSTSTVLSVGGSTANYRIFSVPTDEAVLGSVFPQLEDDEVGVTWRIVDYIDSQTEIEQLSTSSLDGGKGYWYVNKETTTVDLRSIPPISLNENFEFELSLESDWNLIGNPFLTQLNWEDVIAFNEAEGVIEPGDITSNICTYNGAYNPSSGLSPFEGGWVRSVNPVTLRIPSPGAVGNRARLAPDAKPVDEAWFIDQSEWQLLLSIQDGSRISNLAGIGMDPSAEMGADRKDLVAPPAISATDDFSLVDELGLARNVVPSAKEASWNFTLRAPKHQRIMLSWDKTVVEKLPENLYLSTGSRTEAINMKALSSLLVKANSEIELFYGQSFDIDVVELYAQAYPNPAGSDFFIDFFLDAPTPLSEFTISIFDLSGQIVKSWNLTAAGRVVTTFHVDTSNIGSGTYIYHVTSGSKKSLPQKLVIR